MGQKRIYTCLQNPATRVFELRVADEDGEPITTSTFENQEEAITYFREIKDELARNKQNKIVQTNDFHFECERR